MHIRYLRVFVEVANSKTMTLAGKKMGISQPTVSQIITELERYYSTTLFERYPRKLILTEEGKVLYTHSKRVLNQYDILEECMKNPSSSYPLSVGATITLGNSFINPILNKYKKNVDNQKLKIFINNTSQIEKKLLANELDLALVEGKIASPHLITKKFSEDELVIIAGRDYPILQKKKLKLEDLKDEKFILREEGSGTREIFLDYMREKSISITPIWECSELKTLIQGVMDNHGLSVISKFLIKKEILSGEIKVLEVDGFELKREFRIVYHKNKLLNKEIDKFIEITKEISENES